MTVPADQGPKPFRDELHIASHLVRQCGLSADDLRRIRAAMESFDLGFGEAALRLGLATQADVDGAGQQVKPEERAARARPDPTLPLLADPFSPHSERLRALCTELQLRREGNECNAFAVISAARHEGRSWLAAEVAIALSELGQPTLLVDADLRNPSQHTLFGLPQEGGLSDALLDRSAPDIQSVQGLPHLFVLTAGRSVTRPVEVLSDPLVGDLLVGWKRRYQHVVYDTTAVTGTSDALTLMLQVARALLLVRYRKTRTAEARDVVRRLGAGRASVLGSVVARF
jgi:receptor protein-tyrosine kinase